MTAPRVFMSHASEDKAFVIQLASRLRSDGVDVWVDQWEILVGDRLVDKIFAEGIGGCDAFLIVLSNASVEKPWVREELNAGFAETIERQAKLLAIRLDSCQVPVVLKSRSWLNIDPSADHESEYRKLLSSIFDKRERPALGKPAAHLLQQAPGYSADETALWDLLVSNAATQGLGHIRSDAILSALPHILRDALHEAAEVLENDGVLRLERYAGGGFHVRLSAFGWHQRAADVLGIDVQGDERHALASLVSDGDCGGESLAQRTGVDAVRLAIAIDYLEHVGLVKVFRVLGGGLRSYGLVRTTSEGRRSMRGDG
jgi:hypothetical protein